MSKRVIWFFAATASLWFGAWAVKAQVSPTSSLSGLVLDPANATIPGAEIQATEANTATTFRTLSDKEGHFAIGSLPPGTYTVSVTAGTNFQTGVFRGVRIIVGQTYNLKAVLQLGHVSTSVTVEGGEQVLDTTEASVGTTIG